MQATNKSESQQPLLSDYVDYAFVFASLGFAITCLVGFFVLQPATLLAMLLTPAIFWTLIGVAVVTLLIPTALFAWQRARQPASKEKALQQLKHFCHRLGGVQFAPVTRKWSFVITAVLVGGLLGGLLVGMCTASQPLPFLQAILPAPVVWAILALLVVIWGLTYGIPVMGKIRDVFFSSKIDIKVRNIFEKLKERNKMLTGQKLWMQIKQSVETTKDESKHDAPPVVTNKIREILVAFFKKAKDDAKLWSKLEGITNTDEKRGDSTGVKDSIFAAIKRFIGINLDDACIDEALQDSQKIEADKKSDVPAWRRWFAFVVGWVNGPVNGMGTLFGGLAVVALFVGNAYLMALPSWMKITIIVTSFLAGTLAAWVLTRDGVYQHFVGRHEDPSSDQENDTSLDQAKVVLNEDFQDHQDIHWQKPAMLSLVALIAFLVIADLIMQPTSILAFLQSQLVTIAIIALISAWILFLSVKLYQRNFPQGNGLIKIDDAIRTKGIGQFFGWVTAFGMGFFQFYACNTAIPKILALWHITHIPAGVTIFSLTFAIVCGVITVPASLGFFLKFSEEPLDRFTLNQFYNDDSQPGLKEKILFYGILPLIPTACTTYMLFKSIVSFPLLLDLLHVMHASVLTTQICTVTIASVIGLFSFYLLFKIFLDASMKIRRLYAITVDAHPAKSDVGVLADLVGTRSPENVTLNSLEKSARDTFSKPEKVSSTNPKSS